MVGSLIEFAIHLAGDTIGAKAKIKLDAAGRHDRASGTGLSSITATPLVFKPGGSQPHDFFPALGAMAGVSGSVALSGDVTWHGAAFSPALVLRLADVAYEPEGARVSKIHGDIHFTGLWPVATAPGQVLHGTVEAGGLPPSDATLTFHLSPKPALSVEGMRMDFVGGQIEASPFVIDPTRPDFATVIGLRQIDLATAFRIISIEGLGGSGHIDGVIPLAVSGGKVAIRNGKLTASGPGVLQVRSDVLPKQITEVGESMTLALRALADFHYDTLAMDLAESSMGEGTIALRLHGRNPEVLDGQAFNLNVTLESNFDRLIDLALRSMAAAQELLRRTAGSTQQ
jgi:hypothetical protein